MKMLLEIVICLIVAVIVMIVHEGSKAFIHFILGKRKSGEESALKVWHYIDPIGLVLAMVCYTPVSKSYPYTIRSAYLYRIMGVVGFLTLLAMSAGSFLVLSFGYGGMEGLTAISPTDWWTAALALFWQYMALLSTGLLIVNLFPLEYFDMGLFLSEISMWFYFELLRKEGTIKLILVLTLLLGLPKYGSLRLFELLLR